MRSYYSAVIGAPAERVWATVRDFNGLATWFSPAVSSSEIEDGRAGDQVGAVRRFLLGETTVRETLRAHSDVERRYDYEFAPPAPFPVTGYVSTLRVTPVTEGDIAFLEWWADFDCAVAEQEHWRAFFAAEVFKPAVDALKDHLGVQLY